MAKKKTSSRKKPSRKIKKSPSLLVHVRRSIAGLVLLGLLVVLAAVAVHQYMKKGQTIRHAVKPPSHKELRHKVPQFEIYPKEEIAPVRPKEKPKPPETPLPKVAIIIDDLGYDLAMANKFFDLHADITYALLPHAPFTEEILRTARRNGAETMLHLPMEPREYPAVDSGPGTLLTSMSTDELIRQLEENIRVTPFIKGVNNHMGSKMTTVSTQMVQIFSVLKKRNLFFIDSRTTPHSLCRPSARLSRLPFAQRDVFLDHVQTPEFIRGQFDQLIRIAQTRGEALGIAHPYAVTHAVFRQALPILREKVRLVTASGVVHEVGDDGVFTF